MLFLILILVMKVGHVVMGPAGSGKSTYCLEIYKNLISTKKTIKVINLDPSVENQECPNSIDIRDLIRIEDVMEEFSLGPNGALIFCMEYLIDNLVWFEKEVNFCPEKNLIFDLPGQIELFTHYGLVRELISYLRKIGDLNLLGLFLLDSQFIGDLGKFFGGILTAMCCTLSVEIPHHNVLSKIDLIKHIPYSILEKFLFPTAFSFLKELKEILNPKFRSLTNSLLNLLEDFSMIHLVPLDITKTETLESFFNFLNAKFELD